MHRASFRSRCGKVGLTQCFHVNLFFPGKGRMTLDPLSRSPSSAFWQGAKVGTYTKKLGVALMQCGHESRSKALAIVLMETALSHTQQQRT